MLLFVVAVVVVVVVVHLISDIHLRTSFTLFPPFFSTLGLQVYFHVVFNSLSIPVLFMLLLVHAVVVVVALVVAVAVFVVVVFMLTLLLLSAARRALCCCCCCCRLQSLSTLFLYLHFLRYCHHLPFSELNFLSINPPYAYIRYFL